TGLASAVVLPDGEPLALLFADPARAKAAVLLAKVSVPRKQGAKTSVTVEWLAIDLKTGAIVATTPLLTHEFVWDSDGYLPPVLAAGVLSPAGDGLAGIVPRGKGWALVVWDTAGTVVREWTEEPMFTGRWLAFAGDDDRLLALGAAKVSGLNVASGQVAFTS